MCVDGVDTSQFDVLDSAPEGTVTGVQAADAAAVSADLTVRLAVLVQTNPPSLPPSPQTLITLIAEERCAPYYIASANSKRLQVYG